MKVLSHQERPRVQAANDDVAIERLSHAAATVLRRDVAMADPSPEDYDEPSAAVHLAAMRLLWQQAPVNAPA